VDLQRWSAGTATVNVTGNVYRKAVGSVGGGPLDLAAIREGGTFASKTVTVANTAITDGFSDDLAVAFASSGAGCWGRERWRG